MEHKHPRPEVPLEFEDDYRDLASPGVNPEQHHPGWSGDDYEEDDYTEESHP